MRPERVRVREFLEQEWLPTQAHPTLEESTYRSYRRYVRLHVVPHIGSFLLQQLTPLDLTAMYRVLLESGRRPATPPTRVHPAGVGDLVDELRGTGLTWTAVAAGVAKAFPSEAGITRHAVAALHRRRKNPPATRVPPPAGLNPRTVRYVHSILHAAMKDAMRWNRVARNVADAATPPPIGSTRHGQRTTWTAEQLGAFLAFVADNRYLAPWIFVATTGCRRGECLGLRWPDVDLNRGIAVISRQVTSIDHLVAVKELPKTKRGHMVALDSNTVAMLRRWRAQDGKRLARRCSTTTARAIDLAFPSAAWRSTSQAERAESGWSAGTRPTPPATAAIRTRRSGRHFAEWLQQSSRPLVVVLDGNNWTDSVGPQKYAPKGDFCDDERLFHSEDAPHGLSDTLREVIDDDPEGRSQMPVTRRNPSGDYRMDRITPRATSRSWGRGHVRRRLGRRPAVHRHVRAGRRPARARK